MKENTMTKATIRECNWDIQKGLVYIELHITPKDAGHFIQDVSRAVLNELERLLLLDVKAEEA